MAASKKRVKIEQAGVETAQDWAKPKSCMARVKESQLWNGVAESICFCAMVEKLLPSVVLEWNLLSCPQSRGW